jgi:hypothetical protein
MMFVASELIPVLYLLLLLFTFSLVSGLNSLFLFLLDSLVWAEVSLDDKNSISEELSFIFKFSSVSCTEAGENWISDLSKI